MPAQTPPPPPPQHKPAGTHPSVAGEEDPGAAIEPAPAPSRPGDEAPPGTPGTGEGLCRQCGGSGKIEGGQTCPSCQGTGKLTVGIGGA